MDSFQQLQRAVAGSSEYQNRLAVVRTEEEAVSALLEIAGAEGISLTRADLERQIEAASQQTAAELTDVELESVSGGVFISGGFLDSLMALFKSEALPRA
jgi:hypothetical protein